MHELWPRNNAEIGLWKFYESLRACLSLSKKSNRYGILSTTVDSDILRDALRKGTKVATVLLSSPASSSLITPNTLFHIPYELLFLLASQYRDIKDVITLCSDSCRKRKVKPESVEMAFEGKILTMLRERRIVRSVEAVVTGEEAEGEVLRKRMCRQDLDAESLRDLEAKSVDEGIMVETMN